MDGVCTNRQVCVGGYAHQLIKVRANLQSNLCLFFCLDECPITWDYMCMHNNIHASEYPCMGSLQTDDELWVSSWFWIWLRMRDLSLTTLGFIILGKCNWDPLYLISHVFMSLKTTCKFDKVCALLSHCCCQWKFYGLIFTDGLIFHPFSKTKITNSHFSLKMICPKFIIKKHFTLKITKIL